MERRYMVAAVAIVATFAVFSAGFRTLQRISLVHAGNAGVVAKAKCGAASAARAAAKIQTHLRPGYPEEAQLLAEMNVPIARMEARLADRIAREDVAARQCAAAAAQREALRVHRDAVKLRQEMLRANANGVMAPISFEQNLRNDLNQRITINSAVLASQIAAQQVRAQIAANQLHAVTVHIADSDISVNDAGDYVDRDSSSQSTRLRCNGKNSWQRQAERSAREATRNAMRQFEYSYNAK